MEYIERGKTTQCRLRNQAMLPTASVMDSAGFCGKPDKGRTGPSSGRTLTGKILELEGLGPHADMLPTPNTINRTGEKMMKGKCPGQKYRTSLGLEQVAEISEGILPKEMDSLDDAPVFKHLWPTARTRGLLGGSGSREMMESLVNSGDMDKEEAEQMMGVKFRSPHARDWKNASTLEERKGHTLGLNDQVKSIPTPRASDYKNGSEIDTDSHKYMLKKSYLTAHVNESEGHSGQLNPDWTECLMGWPPGWTSLEPLPPEVWEMWRAQFDAWWPSHRPTAWHCLELIYPRLTTIKEHRTNRLKAIGNGQVPQTHVMAFKTLSRAAQ